MSDHTHYDVSALITHLEGDGFDPDGAAITRHAQALNTQERLPLYINVFIGLGALISSLFLLFFLGLSKLVDFGSAPNMTMTGLALLGGGFTLYLTRDQDAEDLKQSFTLQLSFVLANIGKFLMLMAVAKFFRSMWATTLALTIITAATYHVYQVTLDRFLSSLGCLMLFFSCIISKETNTYNVSEPLFLLIGAQLYAAKHLWMDGKLKSEYIPLGYAVISSLCVNVLFLAAKTHIRRYGEGEELLVMPITLALAGALIGLIIWAADGLQQVKSSRPLLLSVCGVAGLGLFSAPGILLSIGLLILGYATHERLITLVGMSLLPLVIFHYYYNIDATLMKKSLILIGTGALLIAGRMYLQAQMRQRETQLKLQEVSK